MSSFWKKTKDACIVGTSVLKGGNKEEDPEYIETSGKVDVLEKTVVDIRRSVVNYSSSLLNFSKATHDTMYAFTLVPNSAVKDQSARSLADSDEFGRLTAAITETRLKTEILTPLDELIQQIKHTKELGKDRHNSFLLMKHSDEKLEKLRKTEKSQEKMNKKEAKNATRHDTYNQQNDAYVKHAHELLDNQDQTIARIFFAFRFYIDSFTVAMNKKLEDTRHEYENPHQEFPPL